MIVKFITRKIVTYLLSLSPLGLGLGPSIFHL